MRSVANALARSSGIFVVLITSTCYEPTAAAPAQSVVDSYTVTTVLDTFSFETGTPSPPDCPSSFGYCTHQRAFSGATLAGTLTIGANATVSSGVTSFPATSAFSGQFCDVIDYSNLTGCTHVGPIPIESYQGSLSLGSGFATDSSFSALIQVASSGGLGGAAVFFRGTMKGDSLFGTVSWSRYVSRSPPTHRGRFTAHRRK